MSQSTQTLSIRPSSQTENTPYETHWSFYFMMGSVALSILMMIGAMVYFWIVS